MKKSDKERVFNVIYPFYVLIFGLCIWGFSYLLAVGSNISWLLRIIGLGAFCGIGFDSVYYEFTKEEIRFVHISGYKKTILWLYVASIYKYDHWVTTDSFPHYDIIYDEIHNGKSTRRSINLLITPQITRCIKKYCGRKITNINTSKL